MDEYYIMNLMNFTIKERLSAEYIRLFHKYSELSDPDAHVRQDLCYRFWDSHEDILREIFVEYDEEFDFK